QSLCHVDDAEQVATDVSLRGRLCLEPGEDQLDRGKPMRVRGVSAAEGIHAVRSQLEVLRPPGLRRPVVPLSRPVAADPGSLVPPAPPLLVAVEPVPVGTVVRSMPAPPVPRASVLLDVDVEDCAAAPPAFEGGLPAMPAPGMPARAAAATWPNCFCSMS